MGLVFGFDSLLTSLPAVLMLVVLVRIWGVKDRSRLNLYFFFIVLMAFWWSFWDIFKVAARAGDEYDLLLAARAEHHHAGDQGHDQDGCDLLHDKLPPILRASPLANSCHLQASREPSFCERPALTPNTS